MVVNLYGYQRRVYDALMSGRNVILQAPTGAGKTRAALYPFLENLANYGLDQREALSAEAPLPLTCRYAVPMRVLASQFEREYQSYITKLDEKRGTELRRRYTDGLDVKVPAIQTGEEPGDRAFESPLTFCTIDQLLSSFIGSPYALGGRQANLNVGAVVGSYLALDEFHLYPLETGGGARTTTLAMLRLLKGLCRFVLMTATFSSRLLDELGVLLDAEVVRVSDEADLAEIMGNRGRSVRVSAEALSARAILDAHVAACSRGVGASLVVCNTVARAQEVYAQLRMELERAGASGAAEALAGTRTQLLHSRFTQTDRRKKRDRLEDWLGKDRWADGRYLGQSTIVVATQVVEVGLNISAGVLHTELAPANSVIQRAGRCARFAGQRGEVIVYHPLAPVGEGSDGAAVLAELGALTEDEARKKSAQTPYLPYDRETCDLTWRELVRCCEGSVDGSAPFGFAEEQALIDIAHTDADVRMLEEFRRGDDQIERAIRQSLMTHEMGAGATLIRNVANVSLMIHDDPGSITTRPYEWDAFALRPGTLLKEWEALWARKEALKLPWALMTMLPDASVREEEENSREPHFVWQAVSVEGRGQITGALRLVLPSALATYDEELGFRLLLDGTGGSTGWVSQRTEGERKSGRGYGGKQGSYVEHISGLKRAYEWSVRRELMWVGQRLEAELGLAWGSVDEAVRLAIACHDIGKLTRNWQAWAHGWQAALVARYGEQYATQPGRAFLAKTDRPEDWREERELRSALRVKRPNHACVGVMAGGRLIASHLLERNGNLTGAKALTLATWSAIARHHAPTARAYDAAAWDVGALEAIGRALEVCGLPATAERLALLDLEMQQAGDLPTDYLVAPEFDRDVTGRTPALTTWLGFVLVRALRLCDQRAEREL